jgi:hypothetical protein
MLNSACKLGCIHVEIKQSYELRNWETECSMLVDLDREFIKQSFPISHEPERVIMQKTKSFSLATGNTHIQQDNTFCSLFRWKELSIQCHTETQ